MFEANPSINTMSSRRRCLAWLAGGAVTVGTGSWLTVRRSRRKPVIAVVTPETLPPQRQANLPYCLAATDEFHQKDCAAMRAALVPVDEFFQRISAQVEPLVDDLFSLSSSFWLVKYLAGDQIYGTTTAQDYVAEKIKTWLELPNGLERALGHSRETLRQRMVANEEQLYMQLEPELKLLVPGMSLAELRHLVRVELEASLKKAGLQAGKLGVATNLASTGLDMLVGYLFADMIERAVQTAVARVAVSLAARGGTGAAETAVVGAGAAGSPWTAGLTLLIGALVAVLIDWILGKISGGYAVADLKSAIDELHREVHNNLRTHISKLVNEIHASRCQMIHKAFTAAL